MDQDHTFPPRSASVPSRSSTPPQSEATSPSPYLEPQRRRPMPPPKPPKPPTGLSSPSTPQPSEPPPQGSPQHPVNPLVVPPDLPPRPAPIEPTMDEMPHSGAASGSDVSIPISRPAAVKRERLSEPLSLPEFDKNYSSQLPVQIEILQGYQGLTPELSISTCDVYNVHFKKYHDIVVVSDERGHTYRIPIGSAFKFGLLYTPKGSTSVSTFATVSEILAQKTLPKVICATTQWLGSKSQKSSKSVEEGEVLAIKKRKRNSLKVFSFLTKSTKALDGKCMGYFTTDPLMCKLMLLEILEYVSNPLPCTAKIYLGGDNKEVENIQRGLRFDTVTLHERKMEASLVASNADDRSSSMPPALLDIPLDGSLTNVQLVVVSDVSKQESLYDDTRNLIENFDPSKLTAISDTNSKQANETQSLFYGALAGEGANFGVKLDKPAALYSGKYQSPATVHQPQSCIHSESSDSDENYETIDFYGSDPALPTSPSMFSLTPPSSPLISRRQDTPPPALPASQPVIRPTPPSSPYMARRVDTPPPLPRRVSHQLIYRRPNLGPRPSAQLFRSDSDRVRSGTGRFVMPQVRSQTPDEYVVMSPSLQSLTFEPGGEVGKLRTDELRAEVDELRSEVKKLHAKVQGFQDDLEEMKLTIANVAASKSQPESAGESEAEKENKRYLASLSENQILQLLDAMGLSKYRVKFSMFGVAGDLLLDVDESILESELGVTSHLHRIKLLKVIAGRHSAKEIIEHRN